MKELLIFDMDGTLVDTENDIVFTLNEALAEFNLPPKTSDEIRRYIGPGIDHLYDYALENSTVNRNEFNLVFKKHYRANLDKETQLYTGIYDLLEELHTYPIKMAVLTNKPSEPAEKLCNIFNISPFLSDIIGPDTLGAYKPDPTSIHYLLAKYRISKNNAIMIGDSTPDIAAAKAAGIDSVGVSYGYKDLQSIQNLNPTHIMPSVADLKKLLFSLIEKGYTVI
jgi:phosphoglycolate phosphatase